MNGVWNVSLLIDRTEEMHGRQVCYYPGGRRMKKRKIYLITPYEDENFRWTETKVVEVEEEE